MYILPMEQEQLVDIANLNVLIIDDQVLVHNTIKNALLEQGIDKVKCAENAYFALRLCEKTTFHVVICAFNVKSDKDGFHYQMYGINFSKCRDE
jgi:DNA-binding NarL/FixJ family response regulator